MAKTNYTYIEIPFSDISPDLSINPTVSDLVENFSISNFFSQPKHLLNLEIYSLDNSLLYERLDYPKYSLSLNAAGAGQDGSSAVALDPITDALESGFDNGDVNVVYKFLNNPFSDSKFGGEFFIESFSPDRTEFRALSLELTDKQVTDYGNAFKEKLNTESYFSEFYVNLPNSFTAVGINIDLDTTSKGVGIVVKLLEPLPSTVALNDTLNISEIVSDTLAYSIIAEVELEETKLPSLKGPNFNIEIEEEVKNPTEYLNYNKLFSYPVSNSYYELYSLFNEKSAQITIDHTDYSDFIHFSSAEERLRNFKYKLDLVHSYEDSITAINSGSYQGTGISGSREYFEGLIKGVVNNFDHYDNFLYFESGSNSWPKSTNRKPYIVQKSNTAESVTFFNSQLVSASNYDNNNVDILTNTIPVYLRDDVNNEPYIMFIHMIAQHFDNLWIYFKAVTDKYDADNRLDFGISKDLVRTAIESFGIKLSTSDSSTNNLFSMFSGEGLITGSELITSQSNILSGSGLEYLQPVAQDNYEKEIYKRIYHNLPYLTKTKGTQRGLRALINCYGIPEDILTIKTFGGTRINDETYFGPLTYSTSSIDKVRLDVTGSIVTGSTLSKYTSIVRNDKKYSDDQHLVEVGLDLGENTNKYLNTIVTSSFNIDDYIGDPRSNYLDEYTVLDKFVSDNLTSNVEWDPSLTYTNDPYAFIRLVKFFDTSIFRTIKQFLPARSNVSTGVIIKPHKLNRNKAKQVQASYINEIHTGSIQTGFISGSDGGTFGHASKVDFTTNYNATYVSPLGPMSRNITDESPRINGEFSGSLIIATNGELNKANPFKRSAQPILTFDITTFNLSLPIPPACNIIFTGEYVGEYFVITPTNGGTVGITYPNTVADTTSPIKYTHDFDNYEYFNIVATAIYPLAFVGWYTESGTLITTDTVLTFYYEDETTYGHNIEARFS